MAVYASYSGVLTTTTGFLTVKAGAVLPMKVIRIDVSSFAAGSPSVSMFTGGGTITGGSTVTPFPLREGAAAAGVTSKAGATAVSGTQRTFIQQNSAAGSLTSWTPPASLVIPAGSSTVVTVAGASTSWAAVIYVDELEIQPGF